MEEQFPFKVNLALKQMNTEDEQSAKFTFEQFEQMKRMFAMSQPSEIILKRTPEVVLPMFSGNIRD